MSVLVIAEHDNMRLQSATLKTLSAAKKLNKEIRVLVAGFGCREIAERLSRIEGIIEVIYADHEAYQNFLAERLCSLILKVKGPVTHYLAPATTFGKNVMPRLAALLKASPVSDVIEIINDHTYKRPIYAGNAITTVESLDPIQVITIRPTSFVSAHENSQSAPLVTLDFVSGNTQSEFVKREVHEANRPELTSASLVISGGRGLQNKANFDRLGKIADRLGAALGATRAAVDAGLAPNDSQVGQTGKVVAPQFYIAVGISGAIQHLAGMKDSKVVIAINKDPEAPIFQIADYGLVGDLDQILPEWETVLTEMKD